MPKARWIIFTILPFTFSKHYCFSSIAKVLPNSVINSANKESQSIAHFLLQLCWLPVSRWANSFMRFCLLNQQKLYPFVLKSVLLIFSHLLCSSQFNFLQLHLSLPCKHLTKYKVAILKFSILSIITLHTTIIAIIDAILNHFRACASL